MADDAGADLDQLELQAAVNDQSAMASGSSMQRRKVAQVVGQRVQLQPHLVARNFRHDSRVQRKAYLPSLTCRCSAVPRWL